MKTLIPKKAMDELKSLLDSEAETIDFAKDESTLFFRVGPRLLTSRQLTGQFPNYEAVLPKDVSKSITLQGEELGAAIARVAQFADERSRAVRDRKSTRLNSSHANISYAVFCLKKKKNI